MLKGKELGQAIRTAYELKVESGAISSKADIAKHFGIKTPSVYDWFKKGSIAKDKLPELWSYFSDVVGPEHWGLTEWPYQTVVSTETPKPDTSVQAQLSRYVKGEGNLPLAADNTSAAMSAEVLSKFLARLDGLDRNIAISALQYLLEDPGDVQRLMQVQVQLERLQSEANLHSVGTGTTPQSKATGT